MLSQAVRLTLRTTSATGFSQAVATDLDDGELCMACRGSAVRIRLAPLQGKTSYRQVFWRLARVAFLMPKKLNIIFDAQNDAQKFGVPCGRGCFLRFLMRADSAQPWLFPESPAWAHLAACACPAMRCAPSMR